MPAEPPKNPRVSGNGQGGAVHNPLHLPRISMGVSSFNAEATLATALQCALDQDWNNSEVVVVDDASTDSSPDIIMRTADDDARVRPLLLPSNRGIPAVRNLITEHSTGQFIAFFDDDDISHPRRASKQAEAILLHEREHVNCTGLVTCNVSLCVTYPGGRTEFRTALGSGAYPMAVQNSIVLDHALRLLGDVRGERLQGTQSMMLRKTTITRLGGFDESLSRGEDVDLVIRLVLAGGCVIGVPDRLVNQFVTVSADKTAERAIKSRLMLLHKHQDALAGPREVRGLRFWVRMLYAARELRFISSAYLLLLAILCCPITTIRRVRLQLLPRIVARGTLKPAVEPTDG